MCTNIITDKSEKNMIEHENLRVQKMHNKKKEELYDTIHVISWNLLSHSTQLEYRSQRMSNFIVLQERSKDH